MSEPGSRRGRTHDAEGARQTILDAGEQVFAEHGFDGARIDMIAEVAGYNKSLIFQYFGDKLGLYSAVIRRADTEMRVWQDEALGELQEIELNINSIQIQNLLRRYIGLYFDYLVEHPNVLRIYNWEMAERWQTFSKIWNERDRQDVADFTPAFANIQKAGLMRAEPNPLIQYAVALFSCHTYLAVLSMYQSLVPDQDFDSATIIESGRDFLIEFITNGLLVNKQAKKTSQPKKSAASRRLKGK